MIRITSFLLLLFISSVGVSQYQIGLVPRSSPDRSVSKAIGTTDITVPIYIEHTGYLSLRDEEVL